jgi:hypothetical protein
MRARAATAFVLGSSTIRSSPAVNVGRPPALIQSLPPPQSPTDRDNECLTMAHDHRHMEREQSMESILRTLREIYERDHGLFDQSRMAERTLPRKPRVIESSRRPDPSRR